MFIKEQTYKTVTMRLLNAKPEVLELYLQHDIACGALFKQFDQWRTSTNPVEKEVFAALTEISSTQGATKTSYALFDPEAKTGKVNDNAALSSLFKSGAIPLRLPVGVYDFNSPRKGYRRSVVYEVVKRYGSWMECNELVKTFISEKRSEMKIAEEEIQKTCDPQAISNFVEWYEMVTTELNANLNGKFLGFWKNNLAPAFAAGQKIYKGNWIDKKERRRYYKVNDPKIVDLLYERPDIWSVLSHPLIGNYIELHEGFKHWKTESTLTPPKFPESLSRIELGDNLIPLGNLSVNNETGIMTMNLPYPDNQNGGDPKKDLVLQWGFGIKGHVQNLKIAHQPASSNYSFDFLHNGKTPIKGIVSQFSMQIVLNNPNKTDITCLKPSDYEVILYITYAKPVLPPSELSIKELNALRIELSTSYNKGKQAKEYEAIPTGLVAVSIDLNWNPIAACSVRKKLKVGSKELAYKEYGYTPRWAQYMRAYGDLKILLEQTSDCIDNGTLVSEELFAKLNQYATSPTSPEAYHSWIKAHKHIPTCQWHAKEYGWYAADVLHGLYEKYKQAMQERRGTDERPPMNEPESHLHWVQFIEARKSASTAVTNYGHVRKKGHRNAGYFAEEMKLIENIKDDFCKKIIGKIMDLCVENGAALLLVEQFILRQGSHLNTRMENRMYNKWIVGQLKQSLEKECLAVGIAFVEADERFTSQIDPKTGDWLEEDENNHKVLLNPKTGQSLSRDRIATENIYNRVNSRHTDLRSLEFVVNSEGQYVPTCAFTPRESDKREKGMMLRHYGGFKIAFVKNGKPNTLMLDRSIKVNTSKFKSVGAPIKLYADDNLFLTWSKEDEKCERQGDSSKVGAARKV
jgi:IS605 OrfB family transposase